MFYAKFHKNRIGLPVSQQPHGLRSPKRAAARSRQALQCAASMGTDALHGRYAVCMGEALFDCLADQLGKPKDEVESWTPYPGGAPANVATGLARLGPKSVFLGAIGKDDLGNQFMELLKELAPTTQGGAVLSAERGVDTAHVQQLEGRPTRDVLVTRSLEGDREFSGFGAAKTEEYADCFLDPEKIPLDVIKSADVVVTGTLELAYPLTAESVRRAVKAGREGEKCTVVVDVNWRPVFWSDLDKAKQVVQQFVQLADIVKLTDEESEWLLGIPPATALQEPDKVLVKLPQAKGVLVSAGEKGSSYAFRTPGGKLGLSGLIPVMDVKVADTTGAGDSYLSGFLFYLMLSGSLDALVADSNRLRRAVQFATACGASTCTKPGAIGAQPTVQEVEALLAQHGLAE